MQKRLRGFSLIELMIVVAIIGILAAVALPSYRSYIIKGNRSAAQSFMMTVSQKEEQYLMDARQYAEVPAPANFSATLGLSVPSEVSQFYTVTVGYIGGDTRTYSVRADPIAGGTQASDGPLTLSNTGAKSPADKW